MSGFGTSLRRVVNLARYGPLGLCDPQQHVDVRLHGLGLPRDVTRNNVVAALRPFTIAIMLGLEEPVPGPDGFRLSFQERGSGWPLGSIELKHVRNIALPEHRFCLFETAGRENRCVTPANLNLFYLRQRWREERRRRKNTYNFQMTEPDLRSSYVFYLCPRPVVLVSVTHGECGNMFPMDLIGPTDSPWYSMALRKTSPAVRLMQESGRMALASVPFSRKDFAYQLGKHHKETTIDWEQLPFPTERSPLFGLPVLQGALKLREVEVQEFHDVGSHMLFLTRIVRETVPQQIAGTQLFHAFSSYRSFLAMSEAPGDCAAAPNHDSKG